MVSHLQEALGRPGAKKKKDLVEMELRSGLEKRTRYQMKWGVGEAVHKCSAMLNRDTASKTLGRQVEL